MAAWCGSAAIRTFHGATVMLNVFLGWDDRESVAYHVCAHSILTRTAFPVTISPLRQDALRRIGLYTRPPDQRAATAFSLTRFLVPYLSGYEGISVFMDCDMLVRGDICDLRLYPLARPDQAVFVAQHDYVPCAATKMDGAVQHVYPRKNWSSVMVFNNAQCKALTLDAVNTQSPAWLHRLQWVPDDAVGALPLEWNWLVGEYEPNLAAKNLHYTLGGPWFAETRDCDHADLWREELRTMLGTLVPERV